MIFVGSEDLGSSEESGKDWDELEAEARRGKLTLLCYSIHSLCACTNIDCHSNWGCLMEIVDRLS